MIACADGLDCCHRVDGEHRKTKRSPDSIAAIVLMGSSEYKDALVRDIATCGAETDERAACAGTPGTACSATSGTACIGFIRASTPRSRSSASQSMSSLLTSGATSGKGGARATASASADKTAPTTDGTAAASTDLVSVGGASSEGDFRILFATNSSLASCTNSSLFATNSSLAIRILFCSNDTELVVALVGELLDKTEPVALATVVVAGPVDELCVEKIQRTIAKPETATWKTSEADSSLERLWSE